MPTKNGPRPTFAPPEGAAKAAKCLTNGRAAASLHASTRFPLTDAGKSNHEKEQLRDEMVHFQYFFIHLQAIQGLAINTSRPL